MLYSQLFGKTLREDPKDEAFDSAKLLMRGGFVDKLSAGVFTFLPLGLRVLKNIENIIREEMEAVGGQEILMPVLHPKENWEKTGRWQTLDILFRLKTGEGGSEFALGPTHEEVVTPLAGKYQISYKDLPFSVFQIQTKFRDEPRPKSGLLRGREFMMKDLYSFHTDEKDLDKYYEKVAVAYEKILKRLGLADVTYKTYASGGSFSKYSHEFQTVVPSGEDTIYLCEKCKIAVSKEIIAEQNTCPNCGSKDFKEKKAIEVGNIFKLMTKFSDVFNLTYADKDNVQKKVLMGCYGFGLSRAMAAVVEVCHAEKGIIWPEEVAPFDIHMISLPGGEEEAEKVYLELRKKREVLWDDRDVTPGQKFADADLIGCPMRVIVSAKSLAGGGFEVKRRSDAAGTISKNIDF